MLSCIRGKSAMSRILQGSLAAPQCLQDLPSMRVMTWAVCSTSSFLSAYSCAPTWGLRTLKRTSHRMRCSKALASISSAQNSNIQAARDSSSCTTGGSRRQRLPGLVELVSLYGARLTTGAQMIWAQVLQPGDVAVDGTCGNGHDTLFMARQVGPSGVVYGIDLQESAVAATRQLLEQQLPTEATPQLRLVNCCHSQIQAVTGSNVAKLIAFNLGYLPGGDKSVVTTSSTTIAAVEAALEVVCPGGLISIMCYIGHPGGLEEYDKVRALLAGLPPSYWTSSELKLLNRPTAPVLLLLWRRADTHAEEKAFTSASR